MSLFRGLFTAGGEPENETGEEVVEKLILRLEGASSIEDRCDALKALRSMAKDCRLPVATLGMNSYIEILSQETDNRDLVGHTLEILNAAFNSDEECLENDELGNQLTAMFLSKPLFLDAIFRILEIQDFVVRRNVVQLLTILVRHCHKEVQEAVTSKAGAVSSIVDLLHENREVIRNNTVLLLTELARGDIALQKLLAFENTFSFLFDIIQQETADSIVVEDCLFVMLNLLKRNSSNQEFFREASLVQRLTELARLFLSPAEEFSDFSNNVWPEQKSSNFIFILQIVRSLVSPVDNVHSSLHAAQKVLMQSEMLDLLSRVFLTDYGVNMEVLGESIVAVSEMIRGNYSSQDFFAKSSLSDVEEHRSALLVLLMSMTNEKLNFRVRAAVFYCYICYIYENVNGKTQTIEALLPSDTPDNETYAIGQQICLAILSKESVQVWFGACLLMHCLIDCDDLKSQLLRVQLSTGDHHVPSSLLNHISRQLINLGPRKLQVRCGLLMLLSTWLHKCNDAIEAFLAVEENVHFLTTEIINNGAFDSSESEIQLVRGLLAFLLAICMHDWEPERPDKKTSFIQLIDRRVGKECIAEALDGLTRSEFYIHAAQRPQPLAKVPQELKLEYQFTKLVKSIEGDLLKMLRPNGNAAAASVSDAVVASYKKLIKQQDDTIAALSQELNSLKMHQPVQANSPVNGTNGVEPNQSGTADYSKDALIATLKQQLDASNARCAQLSDAYVWVENAKQMNEKWQTETVTLQGWLQQWRDFEAAKVAQGTPYEAYVQQVLSETRACEARYNDAWNAYQQLSAQYAQGAKEMEMRNQQLLEQQQHVAYLTAQLQQMSQTPAQPAVPNDEAHKQLSKEHEDLLVLLAEQDARITTYKQRLKALGEAVSDEEVEE